MANQEAIREAIERRAVVRRATKYSDDWQPCNREAGVEQVGNETLVHLHVNNGESGKLLLNQMAAEVRRAISKLDPSLTVTELDRKDPCRQVLAITNQSTKEGSDATPETKTSPGSKGRSDNRHSGNPVSD